MFNLQRYAEEAVTGEANTVSDAGEQTDTVKSFDELIEGDYRDEYRSRVEGIVKQRLKNHAETKQKLSELTELISGLGSEMGITSTDPHAIIEELKRTRAGATAEAEEAFSDKNKEGSKAPVLDLSVINRVKDIVHRVNEAKQFYPELDMAMEMRDPEFVALLRSTNNDPKRAYEMKYHDRILTNAMHYAVKQTESRLADNMANGINRPTENAVHNGSAVNIYSDPKSLTKAQRSEIKKRVRRGEKILW